MVSHEGTSSFVLLIVSVKCIAQVSMENWFCGHGRITRLMSYNSLTGSCWKYAAQVNHCCALHDNCYDLQLGRENCDDKFCDCLKGATAPDTCIATEIKCQLIKSVGQQAYYDAASYTEPPDFVRIVPNIHGLENTFDNVYEMCPKVMLTIKSCSLIANSCLKNEKQEMCMQKLARCLEEAGELQNTDNCRRAVLRVQQLSRIKDGTMHKQRVKKEVESGSKREVQYESTKVATSTESLPTTPEPAPDSKTVGYRLLHHGTDIPALVAFLVVITMVVIAVFYFNFKRKPNYEVSDFLRKGEILCKKLD